MGLKSGSRESGIDESEQDSGSEDGNGLAEPEGESKAQQETRSGGRVKAETSEKAGERTEENEGVSESEDDMGRALSDSRGEGDEGSANDSVEGKSESGGQFSVDSLPYKLRRQNVNEGREQVPYFLRPEVTEQEEKLKRTLEDELGETVYKSDYREAAMVVAQRNPELIAEVLREWGYDLTE